MTQALTQDLDYYDAIIDRGRDMFMEVGAALLTVRDEKLYLEHYTTFSDYIEVRHGFSARRAYQLMSAVATMEELTELLVHNEPVPQNELQVRALTTVAETPKEQAKVWKKSCKAAEKLEDGTPLVTADLILEVGEQAKSKKLPTPPESRAIDDLLGQLRKAFEKPHLLADKLREAMRTKAKARGGFDTRVEGYLKKVNALMDKYKPDTLVADVVRISADWEATKAIVDQETIVIQKAVTTLKR